jgi:hypothetical protein
MSSKRSIRLDLDRGDSFLCDLRDFALGFLGSDQPDRMGDRNAAADRAAEQAMHRQPPLSAGKIISREFHRRFGIGVTFDDAVHPRMQFPDLARHTAFHGWREISRDDLEGCCGTLAEVTAELTAPVLERRRLAPAHGPGRIDHLDQHIAADRLGQTGPFMLTSRRQRDMMKLDRSNGNIRHARTVDG